MKIDTPIFKSIFTPEVTTLASLFKEYGHELRIAGGAVRDILMDKEPKDIDFATTATPEQMKEMFTSEGIRMINAKGESHGTVTPRINDKQSFEVTTLRIDVRTDGRHADVEFTKDWKLDANRRDLTINSMFLGLDGTLYDYFSGYEDLKKRRVAFVGDPATRIQEDYLRILRYFRFYGRIAESADTHEQKSLEAIEENAEGLKKISGERIWSELNKILSGNFAGELLKTMVNLGIAPYIGLPSDPNVEELQQMLCRAAPERPRPITCIAAMLLSEEQMMEFHERVKLSAVERDLGLFVIRHRESKLCCEHPLRPYKLLVLTCKGKTALCREGVAEVLRYRGEKQLLQEFESWPTPRFPVSGHMLREQGVPGGKTTGVVLDKLKHIWNESDCQMSPEQLLDSVPEILHALGLSPQTKPKK